MGTSWLTKWPTSTLAQRPYCDTLHLGACVSSALLAKF